MNSPLLPANWPGGPKLCPVVHLPAFADKGALKAFFEKYCPSVVILRVGKCKDCGHWHAKT